MAPERGTLETWADVEARIVAVVEGQGYARSKWLRDESGGTETNAIEVARTSFDVLRPEEQEQLPLGGGVVRVDQLVQVIAWVARDHRAKPEDQRASFASDLEDLERALHDELSSGWVRAGEGITIAPDPEHDAIVGVIAGVMTYDQPLNAA